MQKQDDIRSTTRVTGKFYKRNSLVMNIFTLIGLSALFFLQSSNCLAANWLHFGYDDGYTCRNPVENRIGVNNVSQLQRIWGLGCDDGFFRVISRSPALYNGTLYTTSAGSVLQAYNARTGQQLWTFGSNSGSGWNPQPVASKDGVVFYLQSTSGMLYDLFSVNASTGKELWRSPISFDLGFNDTVLPTIDQTNNRIYLVAPAFGPDEGALYAINKETGKIAWYKSKTAGNLSAKGDYVLLKGAKIFGLADVDWFDYQMYRLDVTTQNVDFFFDIPAPLPDTEDKSILQYSLCGNRLIVGIGVNDDHITDVDKGSVVIYNTGSPAVVQRIDFPYPITGQIACNTTTNTLYIPTNPYLYALNADTGQEVWRHMGYGSIFTPSIANGVVYFISDTNMYAVNEKTGQQLFSFALGYSGEDSSQVAIDDGMLYFSGNGGTCDLFALGSTIDSPIDEPTLVNLSGRVKTTGGSDICAMVLASGRYMFSCDPNGVFSLQDLPRDTDGTVELQIYADGFYPYILELNESGHQEITMTASESCPDYNQLYDPGVFPGSAGRWIDISGQVLAGQHEKTPVCAMILANGQHMFSCNGSGNYALNVPLDSNGQVSLQVYADGFAPVTLYLDEFHTHSIVRMARTSECR